MSALPFTLLSAYRPSHTWQFTPSPPTYCRQLGLLESKFDYASQDLGQSDTFLQLSLTSAAFPPETRNALLARLPLAWARLRALHPALACRVVDGGAPEDNWMQLPRRRFVYEPPADGQAAVDAALRSLLVEPAGGRTMQQVVEEVVLNGELRLIGFGCLARLLVFPDEAEGCGIVLHISHTVSPSVEVKAHGQSLTVVFSCL